MVSFTPLATLRYLPEGGYYRTAHLTVLMKRGVIARSSTPAGVARPGGRLLPYRSSYRLDEALGDCAKHFARGGFPALRALPAPEGGCYSPARLTV